MLIRAWATYGDGGLQQDAGTKAKVLEVSDASKLPGIFLSISPSENKTILLACRASVSFSFRQREKF